MNPIEWEVQWDPTLTPEQIQRESDDDAAAMLAEEMTDTCPPTPARETPTPESKNESCGD